MKPAKSFDCVEMKNQIQAKLLEERRLLGDREFERRQRQWLESSGEPLARWWRSLRSQAIPTASNSKR